VEHSRRCAVPAFALLSPLLALFVQCCSRPSVCQPVSAQRAELIEALGPCRLLEGRLAGFHYAQLGRRPRRLTASHLKAVRALRNRASAASLSTLAILTLSEAANLNKAIILLERARAISPKDATIAGDLAAAYLERAHRSGPRDLLTALDMAMTAVALDEHLPEPHFNLALALESLYLNQTARREWSRVLDLDGTSGWADEAATHLRGLATLESNSNLSQRHKLGLAAAVFAGDDSLLLSLTRDSRQAARLYGEQELLDRWAQDEATGEEHAARAELRGARRLGDILGAISRDWMLHDAVAAIDRAADDPLLMRTLSRGHHLYAEALRLYDSYQNAEAGLLFTASSLALARGGSPLRLWSSFFLAACHYQESSYDQSLAALTRLEREPELSRYPNLAGRLKWLRGVILAITAQPAAALVEYLAAREFFEQTGEHESHAAVEGLISEVFYLLGNETELWAHLYRALEGTTILRDSRRRHQIFHAAAEASMQENKAGAALCFQDEAVGTAFAARNTVQIALGLAGRARIEVDLGEQRKAEMDLKRAHKMAALSGDAALAADVLLASAEVAGTKHREDAIVEFSAALPMLRKTHYDLRLVDFFLGRGRLLEHVGRRTEARADFLRGIEHLEKVSRSLSVNARAAYLDHSFRVFDEMVRLEASSFASPYDESFAYLERARCDALAAWTSGKTDPLSAVRLSDVARQLPISEVLVEFAVFPERLLAWVIESGRVRSVELPLPEAALKYLVNRFAASIGGPGGNLQTNAALYQALITPLALPGSRPRLIIVPDKSLYQVPFAALYNRATGRFLVEDYIIALTPSASLHLAMGRSRRHEGTTPTALVVGDPSFDQNVSPGLTPLRWARHEAEAIAALYPRTELLTGSTATKERFLAGLSDHGIVHIAAHAETSAHFSAFSRLLFAPAGHDTGVLFAHELYNRRFPRTVLVVLSGCATGAGRLSPTEGILSLARPFLAGGVPAVIGSLWQVDDEAASTLSIAFHSRFSRGRDAASALAFAQRAELRDATSKLRDPRTWGAFELIGATRSITRGEN
jgi:CHAT domain-containing protein/tetratricopeptide (TPR) repeat protein